MVKGDSDQTGFTVARIYGNQTKVARIVIAEDVFDPNSWSRNAHSVPTPLVRRSPT